MRIKILDRQKLEETVCECYQVVKDEFISFAGIRKNSLLGYETVTLVPWRDRKNQEQDRNFRRRLKSKGFSILPSQPAANASA